MKGFEPSIEEWSVLQLTWRFPDEHLKQLESIVSTRERIDIVIASTSTTFAKEFDVIATIGGNDLHGVTLADC
jgi:hypothetical protein